MEPSHLDKGKEQAHQGDYHSAIATFSQAIALDPYLAEAYYRRGLAYANIGNLHAAVFDYTEALKHDQSRMEFYFARAFGRLELKNFSGALTDIQSAIGRNLHYAPAHQLKGTIETKLTMFPAAISSFKQAAQLYLAANDKENCRICLQKIEKLQCSTAKTPEKPQQHPPKLLSQAQIFTQILQQAERGDCIGALQALDWAIQVDDKDARVYCCRGIVKSKMGNKQGAIADFNSALELNPADAIALRNRGKLRFLISDYLGAMGDLNQVLHIDSQDAMSYVARGEVCIAMGNYQGAISDFSQAIAMKPDYPEAYLSRAQAYAHQEEIQKAISDRQIAASQFCAKQDWDNYNKTLNQLKQFQSPSFRADTSNSGNFAFLQTSEPQLAALAILAEKYYTNDPVTCLMKLRQFGELLAQLVAKKVGVYLMPDEPQLDLLNRLHYTGYLPDDMHRMFQDIRREGNRAAHDRTGDRRLALKHLKSARELGIWYCRSFGSNAFITPDPFIPPSEP